VPLPGASAAALGPECLRQQHAVSLPYRRRDQLRTSATSHATVAVRRWRSGVTVWWPPCSGPRQVGRSAVGEYRSVSRRLRKTQLGSAPDGRGGMEAPGATVRFRLEDGSLGFGSSWSVQTKTSTNDVYIAHREGARWTHTSLHQSGRSHYAVSDAGRARLRDGESPYLAVSRDRPAIFPGWTHEKRIVVAKSELRKNWSEAVKQKAGMVAVPTDPEHNAVAVDMFLSATDAASVEIQRCFPIAHMALGGGAQLEIIARPLTIDFDLRVLFAPQIAEARAGLLSCGWDGKSPTRVVIFGKDEDTGTLEEVEVAIDP
jgi:hypothetical protein